MSAPNSIFGSPLFHVLNDGKPYRTQPCYGCGGKGYVWRKDYYTGDYEDACTICAGRGYVVTEAERA